MASIQLSPNPNEFSGAWEYELIADYAYVYGKSTTIMVPRWFSYDGATIPSVAWQAMYTPFDPIVMQPALVHDWIYSNHQIPRDAADKLLKKLLEQNGVPGWKAEIIYLAVSDFGGGYWKQSPDDLRYLEWLCKKLKDAGIDVTPYHFPPPVLKAMS